jgi:hypothetical protein
MARTHALCLISQNRFIESWDYRYLYPANSTECQVLNIRF